MEDFRIIDDFDLDTSYLPKRVRMISLGDCGAGKSCLIKRHCEHRFVSRYVMTIGIDYGVIKVPPTVHGLSDETISISIFDVGGHDAFKEVRQEFYEDTQVVLLVFDVRTSNPCEGLQRWISEFEFGGGNLKSCLVIIAANKRDLAPILDLTDVRIWAETKRFRFIESSAATEQGVKEIFTLVCGAAERSSCGPIEVNFTDAQIGAVRRIRAAKDNFEILGLPPGSTRDQINRQYKKLAILLHPDKSLAPGAEEAFKLLTIARSALLKFAN